MTTFYIVVLLFLLLLMRCSNVEKAGTPFAPTISAGELKSRDCTEIQVVWQPFYQWNYNKKITDYLAEVREWNSSEWLSCTSLCFRCTFRGLKPETEYIVRVSAKNSRGYGNPSPIKAIRTDPTGNLATIVGLNKIPEDKGSPSPANTSNTIQDMSHGSLSNQTLIVVTFSFHKRKHKD